MDPYDDVECLQLMKQRLHRIASAVDTVALALREVGLEKPAKTLYMCGSDIYSEAGRCAMVAKSVGNLITDAVLRGNNKIAEAFDRNSRGEELVTEYEMKLFFEALSLDMVRITEEKSVQTSISGFSGKPAPKLDHEIQGAKILRSFPAAPINRGYPLSLCGDERPEPDMDYFAGRDGHFGHGLY